MIPNIQNPERLIPLNEARDHLGIGPTSLFKILRNGELRAVKIGRKTLIPSSELARFQNGLPAARKAGGLR